MRNFFRLFDCAAETLKPAGLALSLSTVKWGLSPLS